MNFQSEQGVKYKACKMSTYLMGPLLRHPIFPFVRLNLIKPAYWTEYLQ